MNNPEPSASIPANSDNTMPYQYKGLTGNLAYPGPALPGAQFNQAPGTAMKQGSQRYQQEQAQIQQYHQQRRQQDQAKHAAATRRTKRGR